MTDLDVGPSGLIYTERLRRAIPFKRYMVFFHYEYGAYGGLEDLLACFDTLQEVELLFQLLDTDSKNLSHKRKDPYEVFDAKEGRVVMKGVSHYECDRIYNYLNYNHSLLGIVIRQP